MPRTPLLAIAVAAIFSSSTPASAATILVPEASTTIQHAIDNLAVAGDVISVAPQGLGGDYFERITLKSGVRVEARSGYTPVLNGNGSSLDIVTFPVATTTGTVLSGFKIKNFAGTGISMPNGGTIISRVEKCVVEGGSQGMFLYQACEVVDCVLTGQSNSAIMTQGINHDLSLIQDNLIIQSAANSYGIRHHAPDWRGPRIKNNTVAGSQFGIYVRGHLTTPTPIENNLVVYCSSEGISCAYGAATVLYNYASFNGINFVNCGGNPPSNNSSSDPILCNQQLYTIDINSPCAVANNPWGQRVGERGNVGCATLTSPSQLYNSTTLSDGEVVEVPKDFRIPFGKSLTLNAGVTLAFDSSDASQCGVEPSMVELIVSGDLYVNGTAANRVKFVSKAPSGHDWYAITNEFGMNCPTQQLGGGIYIDYADIRNSEYGVYFVTSTSGSYVKNSIFYNNEIAIGIYHGGAGSVLIADQNTITLGPDDEKGIILNQFVGSAIVSNNVIIGNAGGLAGIDCVGVNPGGAPQQTTITGNTITDFSTGKGISVPLSGFAPRLTKNVINGCKWGIYLANGTATMVGDEADTTSDNIVTGNSTAALFVTGSTTTGKVRQNRFTGNGTGIITKGNSNPDLGTTGSLGKNILTGNTNYCLWNQSTSGTVSARGNYRGPCDFTVCWSGSFDLAEALCTAPSGAREIEVESVSPGLSLEVTRIQPNPLHVGGSVRIELKSSGVTRVVTATLHDLSGRLVRELGVMTIQPGAPTLSWDGRDQSGHPVSSGLYFFKLAADDGLQATAKVLVVR